MNSPYWPLKMKTQLRSTSRPNSPNSSEASVDQAVVERGCALNLRLAGDVTDIHRIGAKSLDGNTVCRFHAVEDADQFAIMNQGKLSFMLGKKAVSQLQEGSRIGLRLLICCFTGHKAKRTPTIESLPDAPTRVLLSGQLPVWIPAHPDGRRPFLLLLGLQFGKRIELSRILVGYHQAQESIGRR